MDKLTKEKITICGYSLTHGLIDMASTLVLYNAAIIHGLTPAKAVALVVIYDLLAFAIQPFAGFLIDYIKGSRVAMLTGIALTLTGVFFVSANAVAAVVVVGIGNALFHLGAGAQILGRYPNTASATGIFVGPGALGLSIGIWFGNQGFFPLWPLMCSLVTACIGLAFLPSLTSNAGLIKGIPRKIKFQLWIVFLLLAAIAVRGFVGRTGFAGFQSNAFFIIGLGAAACIGKIVGGIIADRFGWVQTTTTALLLAGIGIIFVRNHISLALITMTLFQMTMPITLVATSAALPGKPAFAFGLTCFALLIGTLPAFYIPQGMIHLPLTLAMVVISGSCIIVALYKMKTSLLKLS
jgi:FSR family fosmidomycin resistance protein-like MFS transporter